LESKTSTRKKNPSSRQSTLVESGMVVKQRVSFQWANKSNAAMEVTNETLKLCCNLLLPFRIADGAAWKLFMSIVIPQYSYVSASYLKKTVLADVYTEAKKLKLKQSTTGSIINLNTDIWTSSFLNTQFLTLTA
jgi:hypothetical protein